MTRSTTHSPTQEILSVSPYLLRPLRSYHQAMADLQAAQSRERALLRAAKQAQG